NIIPSWINNVGFFNYKETTYLKTKLDQIKPQYYSMMIIKPSSFISHIETEQRSNTYLGIFGVIGGAWGLVVGFYAFLFGESLIHPWGFIQKNCCRIKSKTQSKLRKSLSILPLTDSSILDEKDKVEEVSVEEFNRMKEKLKSLEILLREYVIDVKFLQSVENGNIREA
ncbi:15111_t:CDS:2, partial [Funneliformis mosseae]